MRRADQVRWSIQGETGGMPFGKLFFFATGGMPRAESAYGIPSLFTGREDVAPVRLYNYRHRADSPTLGRFLQVDPVRFIAGWLSFYTYAKNGAAFVSDPRGLIFEIGEPLGDELPRGDEGAARETTAILRAEWECIRHGKYTPALQHLAKLVEKSPEVSVVVRVGRTGGEFARDPVVQKLMAAIRALTGGPDIDAETPMYKGKRLPDEIVDSLLRRR